MCGIIGHIRVNGSNSNRVCQEGLATLQYRGYDSAGIAGIHEGNIQHFKRIGKVSELSQFTTPLEIAIAHTRWATHGGITEENAHPHFNEKKTLFLVHNGIIENYIALKEQIDSPFISKTDTEVIAHLLSKHYEGSLAEAMLKIIPMLEGTFAIAAIHIDEPDKIVCATRSAPLIIGRCKQTNDIFLASDANAFGANTLDIFYLENDEIAELSESKISIRNKFGVELLKKSEPLKLKTSSLDKGGHDHFLLKEILEQPKALSTAISGKIDQKKMTATFEELSISDKTFQECDHITILACGSSFHAGCIAKQFIEKNTDKHVSVEIASEFRYGTPLLTDKSVVIAISQSGETTDTIAAIQHALAKTSHIIALCNVATSTISRMVKNTILLNAGPEISVCSTKAFTSQLMILFLLSLKIGRLIKMTSEEGEKMIRGIQEMIDSIETLFSRQDEIEELANYASTYENAFFIGRQEMYPTCLEAALKLKEISYINALGIAAGELKHGTIALITPSTLTIALCGNTKTLDKMESNIMEIKARNGPIIAFANEGDDQFKRIAEKVFFLPKLDDYFSPFLYAVATQFFAYYIARNRKCDIDQPRNLAKSVTVE